jgi:glycosyltransferase involved in cell wall biosynthesis
VRVVYAFPEPLPLDRARGVQTAHAVAELARLDVDVQLYHVPGGGHPLTHYGVTAPPSLRLVALSRSLPWPLSRVHSNRLFHARLARRMEGDVVLVRHLKLAAMLLERPRPARVVYEAHEVFSDTAPERTRAMRSAEERLVVSRAAGVIANTAATLARLEALYGPAGRSAVIPNGVDRPETIPPKDWQDARHRIIYAGSFFPWKGAGDLVEAATHLPGCRIELVGGDEQRIAEFRRTVQPGGAEVVMPGAMSHRATMERLASACIAVLPNRDDADSAFTSPIKLFEYMATGCAVVATDLPALREVLAPDDAVWARPGDAQSLAQAIRVLTDDMERARELGARLRDKSRDFTWQARARKVKAFLEQVASA